MLSLDCESCVGIRYVAACGYGQTLRSAHSCVRHPIMRDACLSVSKCASRYPGIMLYVFNSEQRFENFRFPCHYLGWFGGSWIFQDAPGTFDMYLLGMSGCYWECRLHDDILQCPRWRNARRFSVVSLHAERPTFLKRNDRRFSCLSLHAVCPTVFCSFPAGEMHDDVLQCTWGGNARPWCVQGC